MALSFSVPDYCDRGVIFKDTFPYMKRLLAGTLKANKSLLAGTVPANKSLLAKICQYF
jgi:hypothetical protein